MVVIAVVGDDAYNFVLLLHILASIIGFGAVFLNAVYGARSKRLGEAGDAAGSAAIAETNFFASERVATWFVYAVPILGISLIFQSDEQWGFDHTWIWLSLVLYVVALGLSHGALRPNAARMTVLLREMATAGSPVEGAGGPPPQVEELDRLGRTVGTTRTVLNLILIAILYLMIFKPGA